MWWTLETCVWWWQRNEMRTKMTRVMHEMNFARKEISRICSFVCPSGTLSSFFKLISFSYHHLLNISSLSHLDSKLLMKNVSGAKTWILLSSCIELTRVLHFIESRVDWNHGSPEQTAFSTERVTGRKLLKPSNDNTRKSMWDYKQTDNRSRKMTRMKTEGENQRKTFSFRSASKVNIWKPLWFP